MFLFLRNASGKKCRHLRLLSRTIHRRNVYGSHPTPNPLLRIQSHHSLRPHLVHRPPHLHPTTGIRREDIPRQVERAGSSICPLLPTAFPVSTPNTIHHSLLTVCLPAS